MSFRSKFKLYSNICFKKTSLKKLLQFYKDIFIKWKTHFSSSPETQYIQIEDNPVYLQSLLPKILFFYLSSLKKVIWSLRMIFSVNKIQQMKLIFNSYNQNMVFHKSKRQILNRILVMSVTSLSNTIILLKKRESSNLKNFLPKNYMQYWWQKNIFLNMKFDWRNIYSLPRITTINTYLSSFQYKICNNILFLNKKLFVFCMKNTPSCSFCTKKDESLLHIFSKCTSIFYEHLHHRLFWICLGSGMTIQILMGILKTKFY